MSRSKGMYLHLGQSVVIPYDDIIGFFDLDITTQSKRTREFLSKMQSQGLVTNVSEEIPASFVLSKKDGKTTVFLSRISTKTLAKRIIQHEFEV